MEDRELEDLLRRYRPAGPPPELRARVRHGGGRMQAAEPFDSRRAWPWVAAAAALLALTVGLQIGAGRTYARAGAMMPHASLITPDEAEALRRSGADDMLLAQIARQRELQMAEEARASARE